MSNKPEGRLLPGRSGASNHRLAWLDGLRGLAATSVALHHFHLFGLLPGGGWLTQHFNLGIYGVFLFFIISGWIIPASLERHGDVRRFWIGRIFRIYPVALAVVALAWLIPREFSPIKHDLPSDRPSFFLANATLLQDFLGFPNALIVMWTLCYEMLFYYAVIALFTVGKQRTVAPSFIFPALSVIAGSSTACVWLSTTFPSHTRALVVSTAILTVGGWALLLSGRRASERMGAWSLACVGMALLLFNSRAPIFEATALMATLWGGTVLQRLRSRQVSPLLGWAAIVFTIGACTLAGYLFNHPPRTAHSWSLNPATYVLPVALAWVTFAIGAYCGNHAWPRILTWLGRVSYSLYLVHVPVRQFVQWVANQYLSTPYTLDPPLSAFLAECALSVVLSAVTYRFIERPAQRLGARLSRRWAASKVS